MRKLWECTNWNQFKRTINKKTGLYLRFEKEVDSEVKRACKEFSKWLRQKYKFPIKVIIYFKVDEYLIARSGERCSALIWQPYDQNGYPYIKVATGDVYESIEKYGIDNALGGVLHSIAHELSHYFQWIKDIDCSTNTLERQAKYYSNEIVYDYAETRERP